MARTATKKSDHRGATKRAAAPRRPAAAAQKSLPGGKSSPKLSKEQLRARVEQLERTATALRAKNRVLSQALKQAEDRVIALEAAVARLERTAKPQPSAGRPRRPTRPRPATVSPTPTAMADEDPVHQEPVREQAVSPRGDSSGEDAPGAAADGPDDRPSRP